MRSSKIELLPEVREFIDSLDLRSIPEERQKVLRDMANYIRQKLNSGKEVSLNFICTHNSRRSQLAQVWAQTAAAHYGITAYCYSGGVEVTAFYPGAARSLERAGFRLTKKEGENPVYDILYSHDADPVQVFSKMYDDAINPKEEFAAVMTCSHADETCPFIPGTEKRIALNYDDPKEFDGTAQEAEKYDERNRQIATEMMYVFLGVDFEF